MENDIYAPLYIYNPGALEFYIPVSSFRHLAIVFSERRARGFSKWVPYGPVWYVELL